MSALRRLLLAGVSSLALAVSAPDVMAGDLPEAPVYAPAAPQNSWTIWVEGGAQGLTGDHSYVAGFNNPAFDASPTRWGWNGAIGLDYRFNGDWHISGGFRYGSNQQKRSTHSPVGTFSVPGLIQSFIPGTTPSAAGTTVSTAIKVAGKIVGTNSATREEHNWAADFMVGRDIGLGSGNSQLKAGVRVAQVHGKTEGLVTWNVPVSTATTAAVTRKVTYVQTNNFLGVGPRLALEGSVPLGDSWSIDYMGGLAGLFGTRKFDQTVAVATGGVTCLADCGPVNLSSNSGGAVFNPDGMLGLSYEIMPNSKLSVNYRIDAYFGAMRVLDSTGNLKNVNRIYHGPNLRLTFDF